MGHKREQNINKYRGRKKSNLLLSLHTGVPGGRAQCGHKCLQQPTNENKRVFSGDDKVEQRQDDDGVDQQAANDSDRVHSQLAAHGCDIVHRHNLTSNQKQDAYRGVPEDQRSSVFIWKIKIRCLSWYLLVLTT